MTIKKTKNWLVAKTNQASNRMPPTAKKTDCGSELAMTIKIEFVWWHPLRHTNQAMKNPPRSFPAWLVFRHQPKMGGIKLSL